MNARPFLKWVGGKTQLLSDLTRSLPLKINNYYEPFLGGGALFFELKRLGLINGESFLFDSNKGLVNTYNQIKHNVDEVISWLEYHSAEHAKNKHEHYYACRNRYNANPKTTIFSASLFVYLNKTCFNGLYRENAEGEFNVPIGRYKNPQILDKENLILVSEALQDATVICCDFMELHSVGFMDKDFVYLDPPYYPLENKKSFTSYSKQGFSTHNQVSLRNLFQWLGNDGESPITSVMLSNSNTDFIVGLYSRIANIKVVEANRNINSKGGKRSKVQELIITNY